ncbi:TonB-dependent receptor [Paraglaciecola aquimarina]|uniref:TonB-dependent receptor n=1 Tax=Paraglaciecola aquimarina TaxID=1235557 RepID=A0ABU3SUQ1_9ALTE|nr:TonB-dependent receptor [Paraglaciecola aquimarina]MDU0353746.1 TonB-dependent receptor [Paraglaciecola aquimarina]
MYNKKFLALSVACAVGSSIISIQAHAQETNETEIISVTGIKGSLIRAIDTKREASGFVDSISAEDIGKFPDQNVAESLQRIPGISIDRSGGEGQRVTVRGFGPEFNTVLVNGRTMATENQERDFSFDTLASELISGTDVNKTYSARMTDGGIGATINIKTARPFDFDGFEAVVNAKALYEDKSGETTPQVSALMSTRFADDKAGLLISLSHQERNARIDQINNRGFLPSVDLSDIGGEENSFIQQTNDQIVDFQDRTRTGGTAVLQFAPSDDVTLTADVIYSDFNVESNATSIGHWVWDTDPNIDEPSRVLETDANNTVISFAQSARASTDLVARSFNRPTETFASGLNIDWDVSDSLNLSLDVSQSEAESKNGGNDIFAVIGFSNGGVTQVNNGTYVELQGVPELDPSMGRAHIVNRQGLGIKDEVSEIKLDATWYVDAGPLKDLKFGFSNHERTKTRNDVRTDGNVSCLYCGYPIDVPSSLLSDFSVSGFMSGENASNIPTSWLEIDAEAYIDFLESSQAATNNDTARGNPVGTTQAVLDEFGGFQALTRPDSFAIEDKISSAYIELDFEGDLGSLLWTAEVGLRYSKTETTAMGQQAYIIGLEEIPNDPTLLTRVLTDELFPVNEKNDYSNVLPTFNFRLELTDDLQARAAYSQTVTRPTFGNLAPRISYDVVSPGALRASSGNPMLDPYESTNIDLGLEWYFGDASYLSATYFSKSVDNFIVSGIRREVFQNPTTGADVLPEDGSDPTWDISSVINSPEKLTADGIELAYQQTFDMLLGLFSGLGLMVNMTLVDSNKEIDVDNLDESFALTGLGDSMNLVLFYEKGPVQFRLALNQRDQFLQTLRNGTGGDPIYVEDYSQVDMSASYDINDSVTVFVEGINLTNETIRSHGRFSNHVVSIVDSGARYTAGIRANF